MAIAASHFSGLKVTQVGNRKLVTGVYSPGGGAAHSYTSGGEPVTQAILKTLGGLQEVSFWQFEPLIKSDFTDAAQIAFDHARTASVVGDIHIYQTIPAHKHNVKITGGQAAGVALQIDTDADSGIIGKQAATSRTLSGTSTENVMNSTAVNVAAEVASTTDFNGYTARFFIIGR